jgi:uncharacterized integral membrane protein (TIGR00697 family)
MSKFQKLDILFAVYFFAIIASELMGVKTFPLVSFSWLHLNASVAVLLLPFVFSINDIVAEVYGKERAKSLLRSGLVAVFFVFVFSAIATLLPPSTRFVPKEAAYDAIFSSSLRFAAASLVAFAVANITDVLIFTKIRQRLGKKALWLRNNASNFVAQLLDTIIFISVAFYAFDHSISSNASFLISLIIPYWLLKCGMSIIETPLVYAGVRWLKSSK